MDIYELFRITTAFVLSFFSLFLLFYKIGNRKSNILLGIIIGFQALELLNSTFYCFFDFWVYQYPWVFYTTDISFFLWGPFIYFYFKFATDSTYTFRRRQLLHFIPAIFHAALLVVRFHRFSSSIKTELLQIGVFAPLEDAIIYVFKNLSLIIYLILSIRLCVMYWKSVKDDEDQTVKESVKWFSFLIIFFIIVEVFQIVDFVDIGTRVHNTLIYNIKSTILFVVSVLILYRVLKNPVFSQNIQNQVKELSKGQIVDDDIQFLSEKIEEIVLKEYMYKNPELQLSDIADKLNITTKRVSQIINLQFEKSFPDYINYYRIEEAKKMLQNPNLKNDTILAIAFDVGFNSKASFNRVFKKLTGTTPSLYKKNHS